MMVFSVTTTEIFVAVLIPTGLMENDADDITGTSTVYSANPIPSFYTPTVSTSAATVLDRVMVIFLICPAWAVPHAVGRLT